MWTDEERRLHELQLKSFLTPGETIELKHLIDRKYAEKARATFHDGREAIREADEKLKQDYLALKDILERQLRHEDCRGGVGSGGGKPGKDKDDGTLPLPFEKMGAASIAEIVEKMKLSDERAAEFERRVLEGKGA